MLSVKELRVLKVLKSQSNTCISSNISNACYLDSIGYLIIYHTVLKKSRPKTFFYFYLFFENGFVNKVLVSPNRNAKRAFIK